ncbi:MAG: LLM class flavin-dependent oxidoreductase [Ectothiorhodospiraceae bacterium]|nr:LLM class flavin-dependent oxidoreductase [Chromatiales bacterium]MCP5153335.1 LLM class flavin-dependent oxidoreductase [Ectothiorhodospiraceae bacterium]
MRRKPFEIWHFGRPAVAGMEEIAARCEALGFDGMTLTDSQNLAPDTYVALTLAARATTRLALGTGVTNPLTRHAAITAGAIASLQALSGGRMMLGIGRGDSSLFNIGHKPVSPTVLERYVADLQTYLRGDAIDTNGYDSRLRWLADSATAKVPVDVAGTGPKVLSLGARLADRVSFAVGSDPERVAWAIAHVRQACGADRPMPSLGLYLNVCVHDDPARAAELVRPGVGIFAHFTAMPGATRERVRDEDQTVFDRLGQYDAPRHGRGDAAHARAMPPDFIERFAVVGSAEHCHARLAALRDLGIDRIFVIGPRADQFGAEADEAQRRFAEEVIPALRC